MTDRVDIMCTHSAAQARRRSGGGFCTLAIRLRELAILICLACTSSLALASDNLFDNPAQEAHARALFAQLRCVVCDGQSLSGSNAKIAVEMRNVIRAKLNEGESDAAIIAFFKARYGDDVLMTPPVSTHTYVLWFAPPILLLLAFVIGFKAIRR